MEISGVKIKRVMGRGLVLSLMVMLVLGGLGGLGTGLASVTPALAQSTSEETLVKPAPTEEKAVELPASDKPTASLAVDVLSQYIWRGFALSRNSAVIQPSLTVGYKGFFANVWGNFDTGEDNPFLSPTFRGAKWNETDFTFGYSRDLYNGTAIKAITANIGAIYYALDSTINPQGDSFEIYYGLGIDINWFKFLVTANQEVFHYPGWWLTLGISRVFELPLKIQDNNNVTLELGHNFLFLFSRDQVAYPNLSTSDPTEPFSGPLAGQFYATLNVPVHKYVTIAPKIGFWYAAGGNSTTLLAGASWDNQQNHIYGGLNVNFAY